MRGLKIRTKILLLSGVPVIGALILAGLIAQDARTQTAAAAALGSIEDVAQLSVRISAVMHALQLERALASLRAGLRDPKARDVTQQRFARQARQTDEEQAQLERFVARHGRSELPVRLARDLATARAQLSKRHAIAEHAQGATSIDALLSTYDDANDALVSAMHALTELSDDGELLRSISSLVALSQFTERASREHALLSNVFAAGEFPPGAFKTLVTLTTEQAVYADAFRASARGREAKQYDDARRVPNALRARALRDDALTSMQDEFNVDPNVWFDAAGDAVANLQALERSLLSEITHAATQKMRTARASVRLGLSLSAAVVFVSGLLAWFIALGVTRSIVNLSTAAAQVRETNNYAVRATKTSSDELGALADMFNEMLAMIQARDVDLEAQVTARTDELRRTLAELWTEMDLAKKIQTVLLPQELQLPNYEIAASMIPASSVGGDYYDVFRTPTADWILIGDVSGHGVTAGLTMMIIQTAVRTVIQCANDDGHVLTPKQLLTRVNAAVRSNMQKIDTEKYMTMMALRLERGEVSYAGLHQDILVHRKLTNTVERIQTRGMWLGLVDDTTDLLDDDHFEMAEGDLMVLYTDGVTEAREDGQLLGTDGLGRLVQTLASQRASASDVMIGIVEKVGSAAILNDDVTVLAARFTQPEVSRA